MNGKNRPYQIIYRIIYYFFLAENRHGLIFDGKWNKTIFFFRFMFSKRTVEKNDISCSRRKK